MFVTACRWKMQQSGSTNPTLLAGKADVRPEGSSVPVCELCWVEATVPPLSCCTSRLDHPTPPSSTWRQVVSATRQTLRSSLSTCFGLFYMFTCSEVIDIGGGGGSHLVMMMSFAA